MSSSIGLVYLIGKNKFTARGNIALQVFYIERLRRGILHGNAAGGHDRHQGKANFQKFIWFVIVSIFTIGFVGSFVNSCTRHCSYPPSGN